MKNRLQFNREPAAMRRSAGPEAMIPEKRVSSFYRILIFSMTSIFAAEVGVMFFLIVMRPLSTLTEALLDGFLLAVIVFPILYFALFRQLITENRERKEAEEEMRRANEDLKAVQHQLVQAEKLFALGKLSEGAAHEILNPLNIIIFQIQLMEMDGNLDDEQRRAFSNILAQAKRITKVTDGLRYFSRQHRSGRATVVDIHRQLEEELGLVAHDLKLHNIRVEKEYFSVLPCIEIDREQLGQVFVNIIMNARDAMLEGGTLKVKTATREEGGRRYLVVEFSDTGPGIPDHVMQKIFDPFFTTKPENEGTGLGLSICYGIIERMGGRLTARSRVGEGTTFSIELPA